MGASSCVPFLNSTYKLAAMGRSYKGNPCRI